MNANRFMQRQSTQQLKSHTDSEMRYALIVMRDYIADHCDIIDEADLRQLRILYVSAYNDRNYLSFRRIVSILAYYYYPIGKALEFHTDAQNIIRCKIV